MSKKECKYCQAEKNDEPVIVAYDKKEAKRYAEHLKHKHQ